MFENHPAWLCSLWISAAGLGCLEELRVDGHHYYGIGDRGSWFFSSRAKFSRKQKKALASMFQAVAYVSRGLFRSYAGLSVRMNSTGIDQKGVLANRVAVVTGATDG